MKRIYEAVLSYHLKNYKQMIFLGGPRQVGKTTIAKTFVSGHSGVYLNWDSPYDRDTLLQGYHKVLGAFSPTSLDQKHKRLILDEIHKFKDWKSYVKGFYDTHKDDVDFLITGSARLDMYKKGGDSLMGRYFPYTVHPFSVGELISSDIDMSNPQLIREPHPPHEDMYNTLWTYGGFPEPFVTNNQRFFAKWKKLRNQQLFREDIRDTVSIKEVAQLELFGHILTQSATQLANYTSFAKHIRVSDTTVRRWLDLLESFFYCYRIFPWTHNITRSLLKDPKIYLWDWSDIKDEGQKFENFVASHLLKAISFWNDLGLGDFGIFYIRTKDQKEVDFVITRDKTPWFLVEAKYGEARKLSPSLAYFQEQTKAQHAFQVVGTLPYMGISCFETYIPTIVPARTFLSQLV